VANPIASFYPQPLLSVYPPLGSSLSLAARKVDASIAERATLCWTVRMKSRLKWSASVRTIACTAITHVSNITARLNRPRYR